MPWYPIFRNIPVVGGSYRDAEEREAAQALTVEDEVYLVSEPENPHDPYAVKVVIPRGDIFIGYLPRHSSAAIVALGEFAPDATLVRAMVTDKTKSGWPMISVVVGEEDE